MDYPFAALVGQEQLKTALLLNAVHPGIGGLLIRGEKGTAKSTAARALAGLLPLIRTVPGCPFRCEPASPWSECPHCCALAEHPAAETTVPFVDLPLGATEDRVLGTLDFERALREGRRSFQPGLLASAHRGILYIDEVNLLPDHLVDVLLDAAALGVNTVEREGVAVIHPARFILIGTMNPEEGELRPQLLDRFGLMVEVAGPREPEPRTEVVRRRLAFERDPVAFAACWASEQAALRASIVAARKRLPGATLDDGLASLISRLCCDLEVDGLRADIVLHKTALALAALGGREAVTTEDVRAAAQLALPHRRRRRPGERPGLDRERLDDMLSQGRRERAPETSAHPRQDHGRDENQETSSLDGWTNNATSVDSPQASTAESQLFQPAPSGKPPSLQALTGKASEAGRGRRHPAVARTSGHYLRAVPDEKPGALALDATIRAAVRRGASVAGRLEIQRDDLHRKEREGTTGTVILFVVDASGSMAARRRMEMVKGAALARLQDAYEHRDEVGVLAFRGTQAEVLLPPTRSLELAERALRELPTGGRTPLAHALVLARDTIRQARRSRPERPILLVLLSDGKANVPLPGTSGDPWLQAIQAAQELGADGVPALVLDSDAGFVRAGRGPQLTEALGGEYLPLEDGNGLKGNRPPVAKGGTP